MNNQEIAAAFAAMVRGDRKAARIDGRNNLSVKAYSNGQIAVYSYYTPIAVYDGTKVVINQTFLSASTARHQSKLNGLRYGCPVAIVLHFGGWGYSETDLLKQAAPLYSYRKETFHDCNGKPYTRYVLRKEGENYGLHPYTKEQAAKDEAARLNALAYSWSVKD